MTSWVAYEGHSPSAAGVVSGFKGSAKFCRIRIQNSFLGSGYEICSSDPVPEPDRNLSHLTNVKQNFWLNFKKWVTSNLFNLQLFPLKILHFKIEGWAKLIGSSLATRLSAVAESRDRILAPCKYCKAATAAVAAEDVINRKGQRAQKINTCFILKKKWVLCFNNKVKFRFRSGAGFASIVFWIRIRIKTLLSLVFWQQNH